MSYLSNLPPGCTMEMLEAFHGEGKIEDSYECNTCLREDIDPLELRPFDVTRKDSYGRTYNAKVCKTCIQLCDTCGEFMDDETHDRGWVVNYREPAYDNKLTVAHAECAGEYLCRNFGLAERAKVGE